MGAALALAELVEGRPDALALFADRALAFGEHAVLLAQRLAHAAEEVGRGLVARAGGDQLADLLELQPELLQIANQIHAIDVGRSVVAESTLAALRGSQQSELLVVAQRAQIRVREARELANLEQFGVGCHRDLVGDSGRPNRLWALESYPFVRAWRGSPWCTGAIRPADP